MKNDANDNEREPTETTGIRDVDAAEGEVDDEITQTVPQDDGREGGFAAKLKELEEKYLRTYADFDNYRKRVVKEKEEIRQSTTDLLLREMLEVKDHLELALSHAREAA